MLAKLARPNFSPILEPHKEATRLDSPFRETTLFLLAFKFDSSTKQRELDLTLQLAFEYFQELTEFM